MYGMLEGAEIANSTTSRQSHEETLIEDPWHECLVYVISTIWNSSKGTSVIIPHRNVLA